MGLTAERDLIMHRPENIYVDKVNAIDKVHTVYMVNTIDMDTIDMMNTVTW